jgi:hypothetical protein
MRRNSRLAALLGSLGIAAACLFCCCRAERQPIELRLRLSPGEVFGLSQTAHQVISRRSGGKDLEIVQDTTVAILFDVRDGGAGGRYSIDACWQSMQLSIRSPGTALRWDSRAAGEPRAAPGPLASLVGRRFSLAVSDRGAVEDVAGPQSGLVASEAAGLFCPFPDGRVAVGDSWVTERWNTADQEAGGFAVRATNRWSFAGRARGVVTIGCVTSVDAPAAAEGAAVRVHGGGRSTFRVDAETGRILSGLVEQDVTMAVHGSGGPSTVRVRRSIRTEGTLPGGARPPLSRVR